VFENSLLRRIFGLKRDELIGGWRKLHDEELYNLYGSPGIIRMIKSRKMRWAEHIARMGEQRNAYRILVGKLEGETTGRPRFLIYLNDFLFILKKTSSTHIICG
jgi:hypothetical protein